jgi:hypothetical protein
MSDIARTPEQKKKLELLRLRRKLKIELNKCFDPYLVSSRPTPAQEEIMRSMVRVHYVLGSNRSGKSQLACRIVAWWFNEKHPYLKRPEKWGDRPIKVMFMGQTQQLIDEEMWPSKIRPFLGVENVDYKVKKVGNAIKSVLNLKNGNTLVFLTHSDAEQARKRGQGFTAHIAVIDEMPPLSSILTELRLRVLESDGWLYCAFTPLVRNDKIRKIVDSSDGKRAKKTKLSILDNPVFTEDERNNLIEEFRAMSGSDAEFRARLYGEWITAGEMVYYYDSERNFTILDNYDPLIWPHVGVVDPAHSGLAGLTVWARHPKANIWYCVKAKYINGQAPSDLVESAEEEFSPFNMVGRNCDCNPSGFYKEARKAGIHYIPISDKHYNKENMIEEYNQAMIDERIKFTEGAQTLINEMTTCARKEDDHTKIINKSKFHTADCAVYFVKFMPSYKAVAAEESRDQWIRRKHNERLAKEYNIKKQAVEKKKLRLQRKLRRRRRV